MEEYRKRIVDDVLKRKLKSAGAILLEGPKWFGKTTTCCKHAKSILCMDEPDNMMQNVPLAKMNPRLLLTGDTPRLVDEWQLAPQLWDAIRFTVDRNGTD